MVCTASERICLTSSQHIFQALCKSNLFKYIYIPFTYLENAKFKTGMQEAQTEMQYFNEPRELNFTSVPTVQSSVVFVTAVTIPD